MQRKLKCAILVWIALALGMVLVAGMQMGCGSKSSDLYCLNNNCDAGAPNADAGDTDGALVDGGNANDSSATDTGSSPDGGTVTDGAADSEAGPDATTLVGIDPCGGTCIAPKTCDFDAKICRDGPCTGTAADFANKWPTGPCDNHGYGECFVKGFFYCKTPNKAVCSADEVPVRSRNEIPWPDCKKALPDDCADSYCNGKDDKCIGHIDTDQVCTNRCVPECGTQGYRCIAGVCVQKP